MKANADMIKMETVISKELTQRIISSIVLGSIVLFFTWYSFESFVAMCLLGAVILMKEWVGLTRQRSGWFIPLGLLYIGAAVASLIFIRKMGTEPIFSLFALVWGGDIAAYVIGRKFGRHKIAPSISPGKSWEGLTAAFIFCASLGLFRTNEHSVLPPAALALFTGSYAIVGLLGDMFESSLKRKAGVKDSGKLIPGHGGLFDRVDALMACAIYTMPFYAALFYYAYGHQH